MAMLTMIWIITAMVSAVFCFFAFLHGAPLEERTWIERHLPVLVGVGVCWPLMMVIGLVALPVVLIAFALWLLGCIIPPVLEGFMDPIQAELIRRRKERAKPKSRVPY